MKTQDILTALKADPGTKFKARNKGGFYEVDHYDSASRKFVVFYWDCSLGAPRRVVATRRVTCTDLQWVTFTTPEWEAFLAEAEKKKNDDKEREARKAAARAKEVQFLNDHEHDIRSTIGRVLGVRPEDITTDKRRGTVTISVSATVALLMLDRVAH